MRKRDYTPWIVGLFAVMSLFLLWVVTAICNWVRFSVSSGLLLKPPKDLTERLVLNFIHFFSDMSNLHLTYIAYIWFFFVIAVWIYDRRDERRNGGAAGVPARD